MNYACKAISYAGHNFFDGKKNDEKCVVEPIKSEMKFEKSGAKKINIANELPGVTIP